MVEAEVEEFKNNRSSFVEWVENKNINYRF